MMLRELGRTMPVDEQDADAFLLHLQTYADQRTNARPNYCVPHSLILHGVVDLDWHSGVDVRSRETTSLTREVPWQLRVRG